MYKLHRELLYLTRNYERATGFFLPNSSIRYLVTPKKSLNLNSLGRGYFWATPFFGVSGYVQCDKSVYRYSHRN